MSGGGQGWRIAVSILPPLAPASGGACPTVSQLDNVCDCPAVEPLGIGKYCPVPEPFGNVCGSCPFRSMHVVSDPPVIPEQSCEIPGLVVMAALLAAAFRFPQLVNAGPSRPLQLYAAGFAVAVCPLAPSGKASSVTLISALYVDVRRRTSHLCTRVHRP